jgi:hypothetical protein
MRRSFVLLSLAVGSVALFGMSRPAHTSVARSMEIARLRSHFDSVDYELKSRDISALDARQRAHRAQLVSWLRDYRNAGRFPTNDRFTTPTPFFRDKDGVLCAMAYLIDRSGRGDIVNKVAATRNNAYIRELADDPALIEWLDDWGLSVKEAARIQPQYGGFPPDEPPPANDAVESDNAVAAIALSSASAATAAWNVVRPSYLSGFLGVLAGTATVITGATYFGDNKGTDHVASMTVGVGAVSIGAGIYGLLEARRDHDRDHYRDGRRRRYSLNVTPDLSITPASPRVGVLLHGNF